MADKYIIMILGVVFAFIGLYIFYSGDTRRGDFEASLPGGIKVKISSLALVVFCVGVGMVIYSVTLHNGKSDSVVLFAPTEATQPRVDTPPAAPVPYTPERSSSVKKEVSPRSSEDEILTELDRKIAEYDKNISVLKNILTILNNNQRIRGGIVPKSGVLFFYQQHLHDDEYDDFRASIDTLNKNNGLIVSAIKSLNKIYTPVFTEESAHFITYESRYRRAYNAAREGRDVPDYPESFAESESFELAVMEEKAFLENQIDSLI